MLTVSLENSHIGARCDSHHDVYDATSGQAATFHPHRSCRDADADATAYRRDLERDHARASCARHDATSVLVSGQPISGNMVERSGASAV